MTITVHKISKDILDQAKSIAVSQHKTNYFFLNSPKEFIRILALKILYPQSWIERVSTSLEEIPLKTWLGDLFVANQSEFALNLTTEDQIKLVLNNITHIPNCKCSVKKLKA